ncbi:3131_t:CDS:2, partial [Gigaspora margarita]
AGYEIHIVHSTDTSNTPNTSYSIIFLRAFFTNTTNSLHIICRINPSNTLHNTSSLDSFDNVHSPYSFDNAHSPH